MLLNTSRKREHARIATETKQSVQCILRFPSFRKSDFVLCNQKWLVHTAIGGFYLNKQFIIRFTIKRADVIPRTIATLLACPFYVGKQVVAPQTSQTKFFIFQCKFLPSFTELPVTRFPRDVVDTARSSGIPESRLRYNPFPWRRNSFLWGINTNPVKRRPVK